jgi:hypothetical protein
MTNKIGVATLDGRAYYKIISLLKEINVPYRDVILGEPLNIKYKLIITSKNESHLINQNSFLCIEDLYKDPYLAKEKLFSYLHDSGENSLIIGIDPGKITGLAIYYRHKLLGSITLNSVKKVTKFVSNMMSKTTAKKRIVRIGDGNPQLAREIGKDIIKKVKKVINIELVDESGTSSFLSKKFNKKFSRDQKSAMVIGLRKGEKILY